MLTSNQLIPLVTIEVTPDIAIKLRAMSEAGVFDIRGGSATLNFTPDGTLRSIKKEIVINTVQ